MKTMKREPDLAGLKVALSVPIISIKVLILAYFIRVVRLITGQWILMNKLDQGAKRLEQLNAKLREYEL